MRASITSLWTTCRNTPDRSSTFLIPVTWRKAMDVTDGYNAGFNLTVARDFDNPTASAASMAIRWPREGCPAVRNISRPRPRSVTPSVNISAAYRFHGGRWSVSASWACADGRPVTPVTAAYFIGERLMVEYGRRNSRRLPAYHRLDLGANYRFHSGRFRHTVSLALINAYGHRECGDKHIYVRHSQR